MRLQYLSIVSILLTLVSAAAINPSHDPRSWKTYRIPGPQPRFPPPDIGPLILPEEYFRDYPGLTDGQKSAIRNKNVKLHRQHQRAIAVKGLWSGEVPSPETVTGIAQEIEQEIRKTSQELQKLTLDKRKARITLKLQKERQTLESLRASKPRAENIVEASERDLAAANAIINGCKQEIETIKREMEGLIDERKKHGIKKSSPGYKPLEEQKEAVKRRWWELRRRRQEAELAAGKARKNLKSFGATVRIDERRIEESEAKIRRLMQELEAVKNGTGNQPEEQTESGAQSRREEQPEDENNLSVQETMKDGVRRWTHAVSSSLQNLVHRASTAVRPVSDDTQFRPLGGALPKVPLVGVL